MSVSLAAGSRLGHYRVGSRIGRGGMGEIYEADDLVLERRVALKILSPELFDKPERIRRFIQEAKSASALNHPHILTVHEIGEEQIDSRPMHYIAMELVEGSTLRNEIHVKRAPLPRLLDVLSQAADALAKAHAMGIIHRDLKPDNIMVTTDGYAKVIDFGLAKLAEPRLSVMASDTGAETLSLTREGLLLGTVGYMSPEQVERRPADERSDIFSFGCILYEAITRTRAFVADSDVEVLYKIVHDPPPEVPADAAISDDLRRLVNRCLEKAPQDRYQSMRDVALELRGIAQQLSAEGRPTVPSGRTVSRAEAIRSWAVPILSLLGLVVLIGIAGVVLFRMHVAEKPPVMRALVRWPSDEWECRFSPDGQWVSFVSNRSGNAGIWLRRMAGGEPALLIDRPPGIASHQWSPQSDRIAYLAVGTDHSVLQFVPAFGGPPADSVLLDKGFEDGVLRRWIGTRLYVENKNGLFRFDTASRLMTKVADGKAAEGRRVYFDVSSDERNITYSVHREDRQTVWRANIDGSNPVCLTPEGRYSDFRSHFVGTGHDDLVMSSDRTGQIDVWRVSRDGSSARPLTVSPGIKWVEDVAADGRALAISEEREGSSLWLWDGSSGASRQLTADAVQDLWPSGSAEAISFQRTKATLERIPMILNSNIIVAPFVGDQLGDTHVEVDDGGLPYLSPNGQWLAYVRPTKGRRYELWVKNLKSEHAWRITDQFKMPGHYKFPVESLGESMSWAPDSSSLYFVAIAESGLQEIHRADPTASQTSVVASGGRSYFDLRFAPDGRSIAYVRMFPGRSDVVIRDRTTGREKVAFSRDHDWRERIVCPGWRRNGWLVVLVGSVNSDFNTERVDAVQIDPRGNAVTLPLLERGFVGTARIDAASDSIVLTAVDGSGLHNLMLLALGDGHKQQITANQVPGISFAGVHILSAKKVLFSRQESNHDLWLMDFPR